MKQACFSLLFVCISLSCLSFLESSGNAGAQEPSPSEKTIEPAVIQPTDKGNEADETAIKTGVKKRTLIRNKRHSREVVEIGRPVVVQREETKDNVVVIAGDAKIDGIVRHDVVVISGTAEVNGEIQGNLVVVLGGVKLGPDANIHRETVVIGGPFDEDAGSTIGGQRYFVSLNQALPNFGWLQQWLTKGVFLARPLPPQVPWVWGVFGLFLLVYSMMALLFPRPVQASVIAMQERPVGAFFTGMLAALLVAPLAVLLLITVVGIPVIFLLACATILAFLVGKTAVYSYTGQQLIRQFKPEGGALVLMLILGAALFCVIYMIPVVGFLAWGFATLLGLGGVVLAAFRAMRREDSRVPFTPPPVVVMGALTAAGSAAASSVPPGVSAVPPLELVVMQRAGFWRRFLATFLDFILLSLLIALAGPAFLFVWAGYHVAMWTWKGTTIGGIVMGIKVVRLNGSPVNFSVALVRSLSSFFSALVLFLGFFWAGWDRDRQSWHDKIAGTTIVRVPSGTSLI
ncbi:MAG: hypothetical protein EXS31_03785 [Pedosphaera sp.]|nr:hypothetical protein [Pedosphaera sp.]